MPRNNAKYHYITLALPRDSPLLAALESDAASSGDLSSLILLRLADLYSGGQPAPRKRKKPVEKIVAQPVEQEEIAEFDASRAKSSAMAALDAW
jgi:hypothetical protein